MTEHFAARAAQAEYAQKYLEGQEIVEATKSGNDLPVGEPRAATIDAPLTDQQLSRCRFVLRYGPSHPEFNDCTRRLETGLATAVAS